MQDSRNPVLFLRRLRASLRGLRRDEAWRVYGGVALLMGALAGLFLLRAALYGEARTAAVAPQRSHIELRVEIPPVEAPTRRASAPQTETRPPETAAPAKGEWYYNETYRDWRYRKLP